MVYVPGVETAPLMVGAVTLSPVGRPAAVSDVGEFEPVTVYENGVPATTVADSGLVIAAGDETVVGGGMVGGVLAGGVVVGVVGVAGVGG